jgi:hypothetical protein
LVEHIDGDLAAGPDSPSISARSGAIEGNTYATVNVNERTVKGTEPTGSTRQGVAVPLGLPAQAEHMRPDHTVRMSGRFLLPVAMHRGAPDAFG